MAVTICAISDTHGASFSPRLKWADVLCLIGDMAESGDPDNLRLLGKQISEVKQDYNQILYVPGNHELKGRASDSTEELLEYFGNLLPSEVKILLDESWYMESSDTWFHGIQWKPRARRRPDSSGVTASPSQGREQRLDHLLTTVPEYAEVILSHIPPRKVLSQNARGNCLGDWALGELIARREHEIVLAGHVHEHGGQSKQVKCGGQGRSTTVYNCSFLMRPSTYYTGYREVTPASNEPHYLVY